MIYKSFLPSAQLNEFVRNYTIIHFRFDLNVSIPLKQRSPKPEEKIVFYINGTVSRFNPITGIKQTPPPVSIFSHQKDRSTFQTEQEFSAVIIFFRPGVLHRLIRLPMFEIFQEFCDAELFFGTEVRMINEQLATVGNCSSMISIVERFLISKYRQLKDKNSADIVAGHLLSDPASFSLEKIAQQACLSTRQFYRKFKEQIGISPKLFSRLSRFNHAYRYKIDHPEVTWSSIAQEFQYTDYHHLEKEFKEFAGLTPQEWIKIHMTSPERILKLR